MLYPQNNLTWRRKEFLDSWFRELATHLSWWGRHREGGGSLWLAWASHITLNQGAKTEGQHQEWSLKACNQWHPSASFIPIPKGSIGLQNCSQARQKAFKPRACGDITRVTLFISTAPPYFAQLVTVMTRWQLLFKQCQLHALTTILCAFPP